MDLKNAIVLLLLSFVTIAPVSAQRMDENYTDPMQPPEYGTYGHAEPVEQFSSEYNVSQIYISKKTQFAVINNQKVKIGDWVEGAKVVLIKSDRIRLLIDDTIKEVTIVPSIKQYR